MRSIKAHQLSAEVLITLLINNNFMQRIEVWLEEKIW